MSAADRKLMLGDVADAIRHSRPIMSRGAGNLWVTQAHELLDQTARQVAESYARRWPNWDAGQFLKACGCQS